MSNIRKWARVEARQVSNRLRAAGAPSAALSAAESAEDAIEWLCVLAEADGDQPHHKARACRKILDGMTCLEQALGVKR